MGSLEWSRKVSVTLATIPTSLAELAIPMDSLRKLPEGAAYTKRSGLATLTLMIKGDSILGTASCNSPQRSEFELQEQLSRTRDRTEQTETIKEPVAISVWPRLKWGVTGALITILFILILLKTKKI